MKKLDYSKEWYEKSAEIEGDSEIGVGGESLEEECAEYGASFLNIVLVNQMK